MRRTMILLVSLLLPFVVVTPFLLGWSAGSASDSHRQRFVAAQVGDSLSSDFREPSCRWLGDSNPVSEA